MSLAGVIAPTYHEVPDMKFFQQALVVAAMSVICSSMANANSFIINDDDLDPAILPAVANHIRTNIDHPEFRSLTPARKGELLSSLSTLESLVADGNNSRSSKRRIRNLQADINATMAVNLAKNTSSSEVTCIRVRKVGTKIPELECKSREQRQRVEQAARDAINRTANCAQPPCD